MRQELDRTLAALADPTRRQVIEMLGSGPRRAGELAEAFGASPPAMSRHLRVLRREGLVEDERQHDDARVRMYRLRPDRLRELSEWLRRMEAFWTDQLGSFASHVESREKEGADR
ncbi:MAG: ArsR/SmtB family transcription factor [Myxococcota bacterium]